MHSLSRRDQFPGQTNVYWGSMNLHQNTPCSSRYEQHTTTQNSGLRVKAHCCTNRGGLNLKRVKAITDDPDTLMESTGRFGVSYDAELIVDEA